MKNKKVMIVSEQPKYNSHMEIRKHPFMPKITECLFCKGMLKKESKAIALPRDIDPNKNTEHSNKRFVRNMSLIIKILERRTAKYYWTHYIKHHTEDATLKDIRSRCANYWMRKELKKFQPNLIFTFGEKATGWFFENADRFEKIEDYSFGKLVSYSKLVQLEFDFIKCKLLAFYHPSSRNKSANKYYDEKGLKKLKKRVKDLLK